MSRGYLGLRSAFGGDSNAIAADILENRKKRIDIQAARSFVPLSDDEKRRNEENKALLDEQIALLRELVEQGKNKEVVIAGDKRGPSAPKASPAKGLNDK